MEPFLLTLSNDARLSGFCSIPGKTTTTPRYRPLIVALHGGSYTSKYFDAVPEHSGGTISGTTGVPFVAIDRPGYRESSSLPAVPHGSTFAQEEGKYLHQYILPKIWEEYGVPSGASSLVVMGHSLGCSPCVVAAALHSQEAEPQYPWVGMILSGRGIVSAFTQAQGEEQLARGRQLGYIEYPPGVKDFLMFSDPKLGLASAEIRRISEEITHRAPFGEFEDRRLHWDHYWKGYAKQVKIPVVTAIGERDALFQASQQDIEEFAGAFSNSPKVEAVLVANAPHCLELSHWGPAWLLRCFGFAIECATSAALQPVGTELRKSERQ
ncbi:uncharacterized protein Z520_08642 [Fonsecaea multimorphosa CBS 102226]|uniref:AB hydrolase-1 domain-containing protein n=1 Tax=Fonsecaea multimorphosa CBS 102226 TaxID=1442371 RepID=A0A0D2JQ98_9EURO|nr:uncharacterized protein Z520_08642 [Fonsecaea multimorphosa CBS 102226]KIX95522.1 hypothetical protein Z520_08642 [Fonsecaea multimorphosa CBS 102226]OAL21368.1 hypothetical protein AYO22_08091 [Fonsecaea multimorphosa]